MSSPGKNFCLPLQGKAPPGRPSPRGHAGLQSPGLFLLPASFHVQSRLSNHYRHCPQKTQSLTTGSVPSCLHPQRHTQSPAGLTDHDKNLWHSCYTVKTHYSIFIILWEAQVLGLCSPCSYIHSVAHNFVCFSVHTGRGAHIHCEIQAGSKAEPVINPPRGKHSSRYCGTFPAAYSRSSWAWECFLTATSPGESLVFEGFCCPLAFYIFTGIARSHMLIKQLLQN